MRAAFYALSLVLLTYQLYGQTDAVDSSKIIYNVSSKFMYSAFLTGQGTTRQFISSHPWSAQVDFGILKNTQRSWDYCNCYTNNGVSVSYYNFVNPALGKALTASFFTEPILVLRKHFALSLRGNAGFAFLNKVYNSVSNPDNTFVSTNVSYYLALGLNASYRISKHFVTTASVQYNHISNADWKDPNEGMNFSGLNLGVNYVIDPYRLERKPIRKFEDKYWGIMIQAFSGARETQATATSPNEKRFLGGLNTALVKRVGRINGFGVATEFYYDGINSVLSQSSKPIQTLIGGVGLQHYLFLGKLFFAQEFARFITPNPGYEQQFYQRYFLQYEVKKNWYLGVSLKSHGAHSDYLAITAGHLLKL